MGDDETRGVVNADGEVYGYPRLYVVDGSIVPTALGPNPSKTIAALAERIAEEMIRRDAIANGHPTRQVPESRDAVISDTE
jgi:cholesterol oxidase